MSSSSGPKRRSRGRVAAPTVVAFDTAEAQSTAMFALEAMGGVGVVVTGERAAHRGSSASQSSVENWIDDGGKSVGNDDNDNDNDNYNDDHHDDSNSSDGSGGGHIQTSSAARSKKKHKSRRTPHHVIEKNRRNKERDVFDELRGYTGVCDKKGSKLEILRRTVSLVNDLYAKIAQLEAVATQPAASAQPPTLAAPEQPTTPKQSYTPERTGTPEEGATPGRLNALARASEQVSAQLATPAKPERPRSHTISFILGPTDADDDTSSSPLPERHQSPWASNGATSGASPHTGSVAVMEEMNGHVYNHDAPPISSMVHCCSCTNNHGNGP